MERPSILPLAVLFCAALACGHPAPAPPPAGGPDTTAAAAPRDTTAPRTVTGAKGGALLFSDGSSFQTGLKRMSYMGKLEREHAEHVLLLADREVDGITEKALYIIDPADTVPPKADREHSWNAPGQKLDGETGEPYLTVKVYYGTVLPDTMGVIWYEEATMPDGQVKENTTLLYEGPKGSDTLVFFGRGRLSSTNTLAYRGQCHELKGGVERQAP